MTSFCFLLTSEIISHTMTLCQALQPARLLNYTVFEISYNLYRHCLLIKCIGMPNITFSLEKLFPPHSYICYIQNSVRKDRYYRFDLPKVCLVCISQILLVTHYSPFTFFECLHLGYYFSAKLHMISITDSHILHNIYMTSKGMDCYQ